MKKPERCIGDFQGSIRDWYFRKRGQSVGSKKSQRAWCIMLMHECVHTCVCACACVCGGGEGDFAES